MVGLPFASSSHISQTLHPTYVRPIRVASRHPPGFATRRDNRRFKYLYDESNKSHTASSSQRRVFSKLLLDLMLNVLACAWTSVISTVVKVGPKNVETNNINNEHYPIVSVCHAYNININYVRYKCVNVLEHRVHRIVGHIPMMLATSVIRYIRYTLHLRSIRKICMWTNV